MKDNSLINEILLKAMTDVELSSAEQVIYDEWLQQNDNSAWFEDFRQPDNLLKLIRVKHSLEKQKEEDRIALATKLALGKRKNITRQWKLFRDVATSAAAVLLLAAAIFLLYKPLRPKKDHAEVVPTQQDVTPGQTRAQLILADGSQHLLDSTTKGRIAEEGTTVINNTNGTLTYSGPNEPANELLFYNTLITANGETYAVVLADGSKAWLNAGASIRYPAAFTGAERRVEVTGEVYFEVAHQKSKPFIVHTTGKNNVGMDVRVLGTHFNINAYDEAETIKTTLLSGSVKIVQGTTEVLLKPGQQAQVGHGATKVISDVDTLAITAWKNGQIDFSGQDITGVMNMLAKWYNVDVEYEGEMPKTKFGNGTGIVRDLMFSQVVSIMKKLNYQLRVEGRKVYVKAGTAK